MNATPVGDLFLPVQGMMNVSMKFSELCAWEVSVSQRCLLFQRRDAGTFHPSLLTEQIKVEQHSEIVKTTVTA